MERDLLDLPTYVTVRVEYEDGAQFTMEVRVSSVSAMQAPEYRGRDAGFAIIDGVPTVITKNYVELNRSWKRYMRLRTLAIGN